MTKCDVTSDEAEASLEQGPRVSLSGIAWFELLYSLQIRVWPVLAERKPPLRKTVLPTREARRGRCRRSEWRLLLSSRCRP